MAGCFGDRILVVPEIGASTLLSHPESGGNFLCGRSDSDASLPALGLLHPADKSVGARGGGLLAFAVTSNVWSPGPRLASIGGWVGVSGLAAVGIIFADSTPFPGYAAAVPVLATGLVIYAGAWPQKFGPDRLLGLRPMVFIGTISYSLYLVHWPLLVIPSQMSGIGNPTPLWISLSIAVACVPLAYALYRWVEKPGQKIGGLAASKPRDTIVLALVASIIVVVPSAISISLSSRIPLDSGNETAVAEIVSPPNSTGFVPSNLIPTLASASADNPSIYDDGCHLDSNATEPADCLFGSDSTAPVIALFGDSHAAQWFPALAALAENGRIQLRVETKSSCPSAAVPMLQGDVPYTECEVWRQSVIDELIEDPPEIVLLSNFAGNASFVEIKDRSAEWAAGLQDTISQVEASSQIVVLADTPNFLVSPSICLSTNLGDAQACSRDRSQALDVSSAFAEEQVARSTGSRYIDLSDYFCSAKSCSPIVGNWLVYRDSHHLTVTFSEQLAGRLQEAIFDDSIN